MSYILLLLFFVVEYVRPTSYVPALMPLKLNSVVPFAAFIGTVASGAAAAVRDRGVSDLNSRAVWGLVGLVFVSVLTADVQLYAWERFTAVIGYAIIYSVLVCELINLDRIKGVFMALVGVHVLIAALNPVLFTSPDERNYIASGSFLGDGNDFALSLVIAAPFCLFLFLTAKAWQKPVWAFALLVVVACVVLTQSRGGTLGLGAMGIYYWLKSAKKVQTGVMIVVVTSLIAALAPGAYFTRMNQIGDTQEGSAAARLMAWGVAIKMATDNPLLGVGAGNFPTKIGNEYRTPQVPGGGMTAHSVYFLALGELGFPGLVVVLYFIIANLMANRRLSKEVRERHGPKAIELQLLASSSAAMISFSVAGAFLSALYYPHIYVLAGLQSAIRHVARERNLGQVPATPSQSAGREITYHPALGRRPGLRPVAHVLPR